MPRGPPSPKKQAADPGENPHGVFKTKQRLKQMFQKLDLNRDDILTKEEFVEGFSKFVVPLEHSLTALEALWKETDTDNDGKVNFNDFQARLCVVRPPLPKLPPPPTPNAQTGRAATAASSKRPTSGAPAADQKVEEKKSKAKKVEEPKSKDYIFRQIKDIPDLINDALMLDEKPTLRACPPLKCWNQKLRNERGLSVKAPREGIHIFHSKKTHIHCVIKEPEWPGAIAYVSYHFSYIHRGSAFKWLWHAKVHFDSEERVVRVDKKEVKSWTDDVLDHEETEDIFPDWVTYVVPADELAAANKAAGIITPMAGMAPPSTAPAATAAGAGPAPATPGAAPPSASATGRGATPSA